LRTLARFVAYLTRDQARKDNLGQSRDHGSAAQGWAPMASSLVKEIMVDKGIE
jgi:hypothetical protein